jgi:methionine aminotransferase
MEECPQHTLELPSFYEKKRDTFCNMMKPSRFTFTPSKGTYFQLVDYSAISNKSDIDFTRYITQEKGVAAIPLTPFYETPPDTKIIRFCFCKDDSTLQKAADILCDL